MWSGLSRLLERAFESPQVTRESRMGRFRPPVRSLAALAVVLIIVSLAACDDDREPPVGVGAMVLEPGIIFGTAMITNMALHFQNAVVDTCLSVLQLPANALVTVPSAIGTGFMTVETFLASNPSLPDTVIITASNFRDPVTSELVDMVHGQMTLLFHERETGLSFEINPGDVDLVPIGIAENIMWFEFTDQLDGLAFKVTRSVRGDLAVTESPPDLAGLLNVTGLLRIEEPDQRILVYQDLDIDFGFTSNLTPAFDAFPDGTIETAYFMQFTTTVPFNLVFESDGTLIYPFLDRTCEADLAQGINPCEGLRN
jgi:hypothetical protein